VTELTAAPDGAIASTVTLIYGHRASCLTVLIVQGRFAQVKQFAHRLIGLQGVQYGRLVMTVPINALERCCKNQSENNHKR
jgi:metal-responsive CopG/Arc/MetJ family transcriptional regulator